ncbi:hypothetical protein OS190_06975 [Sulfitobacter sp. F26204]|uniref:hypothetical protein n=1 Tax=Sulfitobacter sp. F26204 TaxID=2996014 RepID=UPI00225E6F06|nr:hypothetical protein [Sulfitobacter sp. F26204]MCX7559308.1 hypothetical protein [Sulfitobacter sp. F26204]
MKDFEVINDTGVSGTDFGISSAGTETNLMHVLDIGHGSFHSDDLPALNMHLTANSRSFEGPNATFYNMREIEGTDIDGNLQHFGRTLSNAEGLLL